MKKKMNCIELPTGISYTVLMNTKDDKKPNKDTYIPKMDFRK